MNVQAIDDCAMHTREQNGATMKDIIMNTESILHETANQLGMIEAAVCGNYPKEEPQKPLAEASLIETLAENRDTAEQILKTVIKLKDRMW